MARNRQALGVSALSGSLIRERRLALQLRQADVALRAGISASYLNLIEHNRRPIGADLMARLAQALLIEVAALSDGAGQGLIEDLRAAAAQTPMAAPELERAEDFAGRFPAWAAVLSAEHRRAAQLERALGLLNDRLTHDPHLSTALHELLTALASVRSTAGILADTEDIDPHWRMRFHRNLHQDSERLARSAEGLVAYLDGSDTPDTSLIAAPGEEVEAWLKARDWHLPELEPGARHSSQEFVAQAKSAMRSTAARQIIETFLQQALREAEALPAAQLKALLQAYGDDPALIAAAAGVSVLTVMRRLALLHAPAMAVGMISCDASGTLLFRKPLEGFAPPRFGAACPLWPLFSALARPQSAFVQVIEVAGRVPRLFKAIAYCDLRLPAGLAGPELREAAMLLMPIDSLPIGQAALPVGTSCRICPRAGCSARREPSILSETS